MSAADVLAEMAETYAERNATYGENFRKFGPTMATLFPDGMTIKTADDWNKLHFMVHIVGKLTRFASTNMAHIDSVHDLAVYAAMMESILQEQQ